MTRTKASPSPASDFAVYTAAMEIGTWHGSPIVSMIGSSTVRDLDGHYMMESALGDMARVEPNLSIWLNHNYELPDDLFGSLIKSPEMTRDALYQDIVDLHIASDVALDNPAAARTFKYIEKGRRLGCSIGCQVTKASIDEALYEETGELALRIEGVQPVEWSVVGIPANQRSWVQNAAKGFIEKSLTRERCDPRLVQIALAEWPRETKSLVRSLVEGGRLDSIKAAELLALTPARKSAKTLFWDPNQQSFWVRSGQEKQTLEREDVQRLLRQPELVKTLAPDEDEDDEFVTLDEPEEGEESGTLVPLDLDQELVDQHPEGEVNAPVPVEDIPTLVEMAAPEPTPEMANAFTPDLALAKGGKGSKGDGAKAAQQRRAKKYHIAAKQGGNVTKPSKWKSVPDSQWGDPVNYKYPMADKAHAQNALSRWGDASNRSFYSKAEQSIVGSRIRRRARALGVSVADDSQKAYVQEGPSMDPTTSLVQKKTKQKKQRMAPPQSTPSLDPNAPSKKKKSWSYQFALLPYSAATLADLSEKKRAEAYEADGLFYQPVTLSAKKGDKERLAPEQMAERADAVRAAMVTLSADERKAYDALVADAEYLAAMTLEFERQEKLARKRAAKKALAAQAKLLIGKALSDEEKPLVDPKVASQIEALKSLAADLGVTVKSRSITLPDPEADLKREAAVFLLQRAWKIVKAGATISEKNMGQLQLAHDALVAITEGALCKGMDIQPAMQDDMVASANVGEVVLKGALTETQAKEFASHVAEFTDALKKDEALALKQNALIKKADALSLYLAGLEQQAKNLAEMPLGRPTRANSRVVTVDPETPAAVPDATYADMLQASGTPDVQASAEEDLLAGTEIRQVRRGSFTMTVRHWPKGWGAGARPSLPAEVMPYMLMQDILGYQSDDEADVPLL